MHKLSVNGQDYHLDVSLTKRLLDVLRDDLDLIGTKEACGEGECGSCLVFADDLLINSCMTTLGAALERKLVTIEGFSRTDEYQRIEDAYLAAGAVQCGYCIPGMIMATAYMLRKNPNPTLLEVKEGLSGNLCRCTGYQLIFEAIALLKGEG